MRVKFFDSRYLPCFLAGGDALDRYSFVSLAVIVSAAFLSISSDGNNFLIQFSSNLFFFKHILLFAATFEMSMKPKSLWVLAYGFANAFYPLCTKYIFLIQQLSQLSYVSTIPQVSNQKYFRHVFLGENVLQQPDDIFAFFSIGSLCRRDVAVGCEITERYNYIRMGVAFGILRVGNGY